jgi:hypothetical protein
MADTQINIRRNNKQQVVLYDTDEQITAKIENFKDSEAVLTMIQHIPGQWDMETCTLDGRALKLGTDYKKKNANTLEFEIKLPARTESGPAVKELKMHYHRRHLRPGAAPRTTYPQGSTRQIRQMQQQLQQQLQQLESLAGQQGTQRQ